PRRGPAGRTRLAGIRPAPDASPSAGIHRQLAARRLVGCLASPPDDRPGPAADRRRPDPIPLLCPDAHCLGGAVHLGLHHRSLHAVGYITWAGIEPSNWIGSGLLLILTWATVTPMVATAGPGRLSPGSVVLDRTVRVA